MAVSSAEWRGVRFAFGRGLDPRKKDGVLAHPIVFACGMLLHLAIFSALLRLLLLAARVSLTPLVTVLLSAILIAGVMAGGALVVRRVRTPLLRVVSTADDYVSALLVLAFLVAAEATLLAPRNGLVLYAASIALAAYAPFGKIRHCVLFFVTRAHFGVFVGRRGVLGSRPDRA